MKRFYPAFYITIGLLSISGCRSYPVHEKDSGGAYIPSAETVEDKGTPGGIPEMSGAAETAPVTLISKDELEMTFCGDIMAHTVNFSMANYDRIYEDIRPLLIEDDITFGNFEVPIDDKRPLSTYPRFNVHSSYLQSAIRGGFDAFSLANNHSNDQGADGIQATLAVAASMNAAASFSGLRDKETDGMIPRIIRKKGFTILFLSVTEILNSYDKAGKLIYYVPPTQQEREAFLREIVRFREENPCDLFILSIHLNEAEYGRVISGEKKGWFRQLAEAGVDVVWGHHPHVMQDWEQTTISGRPVLFLYSMGNLISGQRSSPNIGSPDAYREYTGDGVLMKVRLVRESKDAKDEEHSRTYEMYLKPVSVTNYTDRDGAVLVKLFTRGFIDGLPPVLRKYYAKRDSLMHAYLPLLPVEPVTVILQE